MCCYYGQCFNGECERCLLWRKRNRCCQIRDAQCSNFGKQACSCAKVMRGGLLWDRILTILCGSIREMDMKVQQSLWKRVLVASSLNFIIVESSSDENSDEDGLTSIEKHSFRPSRFWKLWWVDVWGSGIQTLIPRYNNAFRYHRVIFIVIAFLGPYSAFGLDDGKTWNRGWRYRR